jgi:predicted  nucleic acid-binding Zn-ribbon protein
VSTFTDKQQAAHRKAFIEECRQKAWGASCHADFISKQLEKLMAEYTGLKQEDDQLAADIKELENAIDCHAVENRQKRKEKQERRNDLVKIQNALAENVRQGERAMQTLLQNVETNLELAKHAETWEWMEAEATGSATA